MAPVILNRYRCGSFQFYADNRLIPAVFGQMEIARGQVSDWEQCSPEEFKSYRLAVAKIMAEMLLEVMDPLYAQHPSIKPPELE